MREIKVTYVTSTNDDIVRDIEYFPVKTGVFHLKNHPELALEILDHGYRHATIIFNGEQIELEFGAYTYIQLESDDEKEIEVFFELQGEVPREKVEIRPTLESIPNAKLIIDIERYDRDTYSESTSKKHYEMEVKLNETIRIVPFNKDLFVKRIISEDEVVLCLGSFPSTGEEIIVTSKEELKYSKSDSGGYNDNYFAYTNKMTIRLINS